MLGSQSRDRLGLRLRDLHNSETWKSLSRLRDFLILNKNCENCEWFHWEVWEKYERYMDERISVTFSISFSSFKIAPHVLLKRNLYNCIILFFTLSLQLRNWKVIFLNHSSWVFFPRWGFSIKFVGQEIVD